MNFQRSFISRMAGLLTELVHEFNSVVEQVEVKASFDHTDIDRVIRQSASGFIKSKVLPTIKDTRVAGVKSTPEKVFALMDIPMASFTEIYDRIRQEVESQRKQVSVQLHLDLLFSFKSDYFIIEDDEVKVNNENLEQWIDQYCRTFADSNKQMRAWKLINQIADALNELRGMHLDSGITGASTVQEQLNAQYPSIFMNSVLPRFVKLNPDTNKVEPQTRGFINYL